MDSGAMGGRVGGQVGKQVAIYLSEKAKRAKIPGELTQGQPILWMALLCLVLAGALAILFIAIWLRWAWIGDVDNGDRVSALIWGVPGVAILLAGGIYLLGEFVGTKGTFDNTGLNFRTPWTGRKVEQWEDLLSAAFNERWGWYVFTFKSGSQVRITAVTYGHGDVVDLVRERGFLVDDGGDPDGVSDQA